MNLNPKRQLFIAAYIVDLNATKAAIAAGYSAKTAGQIGARLLKNVEISSEIERRLGQSLEKAQLTVERVDKELARLAFSDVRALFDDKGQLLAPKDLPEDAARAVAAIEVTEEFKGHGEVRERVGYTKKVKLWDKGSALALAMKRLGMIQESKTVNVSVTLEQLVVQSMPGDGAKVIDGEKK